MAIRSSTGSMSRAIASSSMADSSANMPGVSPGARNHDGVGTSRRARRWVLRRAAPPYIARATVAVCSVNSFRREDWLNASWETAVMVPSFAAPRRTRENVGVR